MCSTAEAVRPPVAWPTPDMPPARRAELYRRIADGGTNRHLLLLSGLLHVARDVATRVPLHEWPAREWPGLSHDLAGIAWALGSALAVIDGLTLGRSVRPGDDGSHADDIEALLRLAERLGPDDEADEPAVCHAA